MKDVVAYYCGGKKPVLELLVSLYSLRKYYDGEIIVCLGETSLKYTESLLNSSDFTTYIVPNSSNDITVRDHWKSRWTGMSMVKGNRVLHPDCDIVYTKDISPLFDVLHPKKNWITSFHSVNNGDNRIRWSSHVKEYKKLDPTFNASQPAFYIEFGIVGWRGKYPYCMEVSKACEVLKDDQTAMSYVLMKHGRKAYCPSECTLMRRARAYYRLNKKQFDDVIAWHCHPAYALWWNQAIEAINDNFMGLGDRNYFRMINRRCYNMWRKGTYANKIHIPDK